jgi:hypothetical protein
VVSFSLIQKNSCDAKTASNSLDENSAVGDTNLRRARPGSDLMPPSAETSWFVNRVRSEEPPLRSFPARQL